MMIHTVHPSLHNSPNTFDAIGGYAHAGVLPGAMANSVMVEVML
jgi:hypothetical protein